MTLTPEQFNTLATKDEFNELKLEVQEVKGGVKQLSEKVDALNINAINTDQRVERIEEKVDALVDSVSGILTSMDAMVYEQRKINSELAANVGAHDRFEGIITKVEKQLNPKPAF